MVIELPSADDLVWHLCQIVEGGYTERSLGELRETDAWIKHIAQGIAELCPPGCVPHGRQFADTGPEYFLDQYWYVCAADSNSWLDCRGVAFAFSCVWSSYQDARYHDFGKLTDIAADRRLFLAKTLAADWNSVDDIDDIIADWGYWLSNHRHFQKSDQVGVVMICSGDSPSIAGRVIQGDGSSRKIFDVDVGAGNSTDDDGSRPSPGLPPPVEHQKQIFANKSPKFCEVLAVYENTAEAGFSLKENRAKQYIQIRPAGWSRHCHYEFWATESAVSTEIHLEYGRGKSAWSMLEQWSIDFEEEFSGLEVKYLPKWYEGVRLRVIVPFSELPTVAADAMKKLIRLTFKHLDSVAQSRPTL